MSAVARFRDPRLLRLLRSVLGGVFVVAALAKIGDSASFALQVHNYRLAPVWSEHLVAIVLPWIELVAGLALVTGLRARAGATVALVLMGVFTLAVAAAWARGLDFECGCFGKASASRIGATKLAENLLLMMVALLASLRAVRPDSEPPPLP